MNIRKSNNATNALVAVYDLIIQVARERKARAAAVTAAPARDEQITWLGQSLNSILPETFVSNNKEFPILVKESDE